MIIFVLFTTIFAINTSTLQQIKIMNVIYNDTSIGYSNYSSTINILRDNAETCYLFYKNGVLEVTKDKLELKEYKEYNLNKDYIK